MTGAANGKTVSSKIASASLKPLLLWRIAAIALDT